MLHFLPRESKEKVAVFFLLFFDTYQVAHVLLRFGNVELHLAFDQELESQVVLGGVQLVGLHDDSRCWCRQTDDDGLFLPSGFVKTLSCCTFSFQTTLQMLSRTHSTDSPGLMMVSTGWSFGRHTQDGVRWSGTHMSLSVLGRGRLFTVPSSLF